MLKKELKKIRNEKIVKKDTISMSEIYYEGFDEAFAAVDSSESSDEVSEKVKAYNLVQDSSYSEIDDSIPSIIWEKIDYYGVEEISYCTNDELDLPPLWGATQNESSLLQIQPLETMKEFK